MPPTWHEAEWPLSAMFVKGETPKTSVRRQSFAYRQQKKTTRPFIYRNVFSRYLSYRSPTAERSKIRKSAAQMLKSLSALAAIMILGASVVALPGFAPKLLADEVAVLAKGDRLELRANCPELLIRGVAIFRRVLFAKCRLRGKKQEA